MVPIDYMGWLESNGALINMSAVEREIGAPSGTVSKYYSTGRPLGKWERPFRLWVYRFVESLATAIHQYDKWQPLFGYEELYSIRLLESGLIELKNNEYDRVLSGSFTPLGYQTMTIYPAKNKPKCFKAHVLSYKQWVDKEYVYDSMYSIIDHIDSNPKNNHPFNLRAVSCRENTSKERIEKKRRNRKDCPFGVYFDKRSQKYAAEISLFNKKVLLGRFILEGEAADAYQAALLDTKTLSKEELTVKYLTPKYKKKPKNE